MKRHRGFSLIELLLVLGVLAILLVAAFVVYPQVRDRNTVNKEVVRAMAIRANLNNLFATVGGASRYQTLDSTMAINAKVFPQDTQIESGLPKSAWGGNITIGRSTPTPSRFQIGYTQVPASLCVPLVTSLAASFPHVSVGEGGIPQLMYVKNGDGDEIDFDVLMDRCQDLSPNLQHRIVVESQ